MAPVSSMAGGDYNHWTTLTGNACSFIANHHVWTVADVLKKVFDFVKMFGMFGMKILTRSDA
jgi:hypothetical protein